MSANIAAQLRRWAHQTPYSKALLVPEGRPRLGKVAYTHYTFAQLEARSDAMAYGLQGWGLQPGDRVLVFLQPGLAFAATLFALFKLGAVPVFIDPGMGVRSLLHCMKQAAARGLIGEPKIHLLRRLAPWAFRGIALCATSRGFVPTWMGGATPLARWIGEDAVEAKRVPFPLAQPNGDAAILFTSGSTGPAKGVVYTHDIFTYQVSALQRMFALQPGDVDLAGFPFFSLFSISMGVTSVVVDLNPSFPGRADPRKLVEAIEDHGVTFAAGSPAIWTRVAEFCQAQNRTLPTVRCLAMFGAPVRAHLHDMFAPILSHGTTYTPYGATECLPVSWISGTELRALAAEESGAAKSFATCVGSPVLHTQIRIEVSSWGEREMRVSLSPASEVSVEDPPRVREMSRDDGIGEIVVAGPQVTPRYWRNKTATAQSKVQYDNRVWHRMGDLGYLDARGRLWFCGRKAHAVHLESGYTMYSIPCETPFHAHPAIRRTALIAVQPDFPQSVKSKMPLPLQAGLVIERKDRRIKLEPEEQATFFRELQEIAASTEATQNISRFFLHPDFPVDTRHNIKIDRQALGRFFSCHPERTLS